MPEITTFDQVQPRKRTKAERQAQAERLPWVTRLALPWPCDGIKWGMVSGRDIYRWGPRGANPPRGIQPRSRCSKTARWSFRPLKRYDMSWRYLVGGAPGRRVRHYCWDHLISAGIYGSMEEDQRSSRWFDKHPVAGASTEGSEQR
jgi:hypothetical protein